MGGEDEPGSEESEESDDENNSLVMPQRKVRSVAPVWLEAGTKILASGQVIGAKCNFCEKTYKHNSANTSNLTTHVIKRSEGSFWQGSRRGKLPQGLLPGP